LVSSEKTSKHAKLVSFILVNEKERKEDAAEEERRCPGQKTKGVGDDEAVHAWTPTY
jgi:hypothetical protein